MNRHRFRHLGSPTIPKVPKESLKFRADRPSDNLTDRPTVRCEHARMGTRRNLLLSSKVAVTQQGRYNPNNKAPKESL